MEQKKFWNIKKKLQYFCTDINKTINYVPITVDNWYLADVKYNIVLN